MLRSLKDLEGYTLVASDGDIGSVENFLLDDRHWTVRYLVADTSSLFERRRRVLISPISLLQADWSPGRLHVALTRDKVEHSPSIDVDKPVYRQQERDHHRYYGHSYYWGATGIWGLGIYPALLASEPGNGAIVVQTVETDDRHLRSAREVRGYHIQGTDESVGHIDDFLVDDETWQVRYLVIDTSNWWIGRKVLVAPHWATSVSWDERTVHVDLSREAIKGSPDWTATAPVIREYEELLFDHYGRPVYWDGGEQMPRASRADKSESRPD